MLALASAYCLVVTEESGTDMVGERLSLFTDHAGRKSSTFRRCAGEAAKRRVF